MLYKCILNLHQVFQLENAQEKCEKVVKVSISQLGPAYLSTSCIGSQFDPPFKAYHSIFQRSIILNEFHSVIGPNYYLCKKASTPNLYQTQMDEAIEIALLLY